MKGILIILPLGIVVALGMILKAKGVFEQRDRERFIKLLYWVVLPCLLFRTTYLAGSTILEEHNLMLAVYAPFLTVPLIAYIISRIRFPNNVIRSATVAMSSVRANNVYLGLPAVIIAMGDKGVQVASVYLAVVLPGYNILSVMWGEILKSGSLNLRMIRGALLNLTKNPLIISSIVGVIFGIIGVPIPGSLMVSMKFVGDMATGLALIALGMSLELQNLPAAFMRTWTDVVIKLIVHPIFAWLFLLIWPVEKAMFQAVVIICAMPTAVNTFMVAEAMGLDHEYACELVAVTTVLAVVTIPVWVMLLGL